MIEVVAKELTATEGIVFFAIINYQGIPIRWGGLKEKDYEYDTIVHVSFIAGSTSSLLVTCVGLQRAARAHVRAPRFTAALSIAMPASREPRHLLFHNATSTPTSKRQSRQYAALCSQHLKLVTKSMGAIQGLETPNVENIRLKTDMKEIIIVPHGDFFTIGIQEEIVEEEQKEEED